MQDAKASDPIDHFRAGTLQVNLAADFSAADALQLLNDSLSGLPNKNFKIGGFVDDSWQRKSTRYLMSDGTTREIPESSSAFSKWLSGISEWKRVTFTYLCDSAFGGNVSGKNTKNLVSFDAVIYLQAFMRQHFAGQSLAEEKAVNFAARILDGNVEQGLAGKSISLLSLDFLVAAANLDQPFFDFANVHALRAKYPGFLRGFLRFYCDQPIAIVSISTVWAQHYLEKYFGQTRSETTFRSESYVNLANALNAGHALLGFSAEAVTNSYDALAMHYEFLRKKSWCSAQQFYKWGDMLVSGSCKIGLEGIAMSDSQQKRECAHYLFRCAWKDVPEARVLLAESIMHGVKCDEKGREIDTTRNPKAHYEYAAGIIRDFLRNRERDLNMRAKAFDKLGVLVLTDQINVDEENRTLVSKEEQLAFARRSFLFALKNYSSEKNKAFVGLKLL